jgi:hypothetical protein
MNLCLVNASNSNLEGCPARSSGSLLYESLGPCRAEGSVHPASDDLTRRLAVAVEERGTLDEESPHTRVLRHLAKIGRIRSRGHLEIQILHGAGAEEMRLFEVVVGKVQRVVPDVLLALVLADMMNMNGRKGLLGSHHCLLGFVQYT